MSQHLKLLVQTGLATREQRGTWAYCHMVPAMLGSPAIALESVTP